MSGRHESFRGTLRRSLEIEKGLEKHAVRLSKWLWPWHETKLIFVIGCLAMLDFASTYAFLRLSPNIDVYESGPLAAWALQSAGFIGLFFFDVLAVGIISALALTVRYIVTRVGFAGYGRAAFVLMLTPYVIVTMAVIFNNIVITFL